jgi:hypothetical protein
MLAEIQSLKTSHCHEKNIEITLSDFSFYSVSQTKGAGTTCENPANQQLTTSLINVTI